MKYPILPPPTQVIDESHLGELPPDTMEKVKTGVWLFLGTSLLGLSAVVGFKYYQKNKNRKAVIEKAKDSWAADYAIKFAELLQKSDNVLANVINDYLPQAITNLLTSKDTNFETAKALANDFNLKVHELGGNITTNVNYLQTYYQQYTGKSFETDLVEMFSTEHRDVILQTLLLPKGQADALQTAQTTQTNTALQQVENVAFDLSKIPSLTKKFDVATIPGLGGLIVVMKQRIIPKQLWNNGNGRDYRVIPASGGWYPFRVNGTFVGKGFSCITTGRVHLGNEGGILYGHEILIEVVWSDNGGSQTLFIPADQDNLSIIVGNVYKTQRYAFFKTATQARAYLQQMGSEYPISMFETLLKTSKINVMNGLDDKPTQTLIAHNGQFAIYNANMQETHRTGKITAQITARGQSSNGIGMLQLQSHELGEFYVVENEVTIL